MEEDHIWGYFWIPKTYLTGPSNMVIVNLSQPDCSNETARFGLAGWRFADSGFYRTTGTPASCLCLYSAADRWGFVIHLKTTAVLGLGSAKSVYT